MSSISELSVGGLHWRLPAEFRDVLLGNRGLRLEEWRRTGQARVIKHAVHRTVYEVRLPGLHFFLKHNRAADVRSRLRAWLRPDKALGEYERTLEVSQRGVPTYKPLAAGVPEHGSGDSFLLTYALEETRQLNTFLEKELPTWPEPRRTRLRLRLAVVLGELLADMHDAGLTHDDLHPGNILLRLTADDTPHLFLIDLHAIRLGPLLGWPASRDNMVILNRWFSLRASRTDRLRCWHAYCAARRSRQGEKATRCVCPHRLREVEERTLTSNLGFWRGLDPRCCENNRRFRRVTSSIVRGHAVTDLDQAALAELLRDPDAPFVQPGVKLLKDSRSSTVAEMDIVLNGVVHRAIYKRFRVTSFKDPWLALFRPTGALRSWVMGHGLRLRWLPTPRPLLMLQRRRHGLDHEGYLLTAKVQDAEELVDFMKRMKELPAALRREQLQPVLDALARLVRDLHRRNVSQRDLKASNVLVVPHPSEQSSSAEPIDHWPLTRSRVWLIDLVGVRRHRWLSRRRKVQNLARLTASFLGDPALTMTDRLRFLLLYLESGLRGRKGWKDWWSQIEQATRAKIARNLRSGRPLY
jgi:hypothetical protein